MSKNDTPKSTGKTVPKGLKPFAPGPDPRRGRGPKKGAPNAGRTPDDIRALARAGFAEAVPKLRQVALGHHVQGTVTLPDGTTKDVDIRPDASAMARAADILGKYGLPAQLELAGNGLAPLVVRFQDEMPPDPAA